MDQVDALDNPIEKAGRPQINCDYILNGIPQEAKKNYGIPAGTQDE
jgi:hypothetical protein